MKYYFIKYSERIANGFGGTAQGPIIKILPKYKGDTGLLEHEKTHVRQWYSALAIWLLLCALLSLVVSPMLWSMCGLAPLVHPVLYKLVRAYRQWCEVQAYRKQISVGGYTSNDFAVTALVEKYDLGLSADDAMVLLYE
ncbi:hypothetical protein GHO45_18575 [Pseudomonas sp. FSL R10-0765]|uniref:hypothetical protein n=1 Tax=Pseudomonas sp. FSL R10-0765 TaxID=2662195 RepID=UPI0012979D3A|nr:hypothetical protein [Pseudomonas sp. FSL R10-0765]MQT42929.1 hypothetical protein [Pseudomonas sp. FSL R10-0765]